MERELFADLWRLWDCPSRSEGEIMPFRRTKAQRIQYQQTCTIRTVQRSCSCTRKMILNEYWDPHKGMKRARNGNSMSKYKDAFLIQNSFKDNRLLKGKIKTYCGVYSLSRSTLRDDNSTKGGERKWKHTVVSLLYHYMKGNNVTSRAW